MVSIASQDCGIARRSTLFLRTEFERGAMVQEDLLLVPPLEQTSMVPIGLVPITSPPFPRIFRQSQKNPHVPTPDCRTSTIPSTIKPSWSPVAAAFVSARKKSISARSLPDRPSASRKYERRHLAGELWIYDLGYFDLETRVLEPLENPFGPKVLPMSQVHV